MWPNAMSIFRATVSLKATKTLFMFAIHPEPFGLVAKRHHKCSFTRFEPRNDRVAKAFGGSDLHESARVPEIARRRRRCVAYRIGLPNRTTRCHRASERPTASENWLICRAQKFGFYQGRAEPRTSGNPRWPHPLDLPKSGQPLLRNRNPCNGSSHTRP